MSRLRIRSPHRFSSSATRKCHLTRVRSPGPGREAAFARRAAFQPEGNRRGARRLSLDRRTLSPLRQPPAGGRLPRPDPDALAKRKARSRARGVEIRQSAAANENAGAGLAVADPSAAIGAGALVSSAPAHHDRKGRPQAADRRARPEAVRRAVEVRQRRRRHRGGGHESLLTSAAPPPSCHLSRTDQPRPIRVGDRWIAWLQKAVAKNGTASRASPVESGIMARPPNSAPTECEVDPAHTRISQVRLEPTDRTPTKRKPVMPRGRRAAANRGLLPPGPDPGPDPGVKPWD